MFLPPKEQPCLNESNHILNKDNIVVRSPYMSIPERGRKVTDMKILVAKCCKAKHVFAYCVKQKGADEDGFDVACLRRDNQWLGHTRAILKSDNEPAIV